VMSSRLAKVRLIHEAMEPDQYVEHMNGDLAQSIVGAVLRNRILNAGHILAPNPESKDLFSLGGSKNET
jgi:hypothetical protein